MADDNVIELKPKAKKGPSAQQRYLEVVAAMIGSSICCLPAFPRRFVVIDDKSSGGLTFEVNEETEVLSLVGRPEIENAILRYLSVDLAAERGYSDFGSRAASEIYRTFLAMSPRIDPPALVREKSEPGLCYHRLPFDIKPGPTPLFDEFLSRTTNADALQAFIGAIFTPNSYRQQYVWISGQGNNGKGALVRFLAKCLGGAYGTGDSRTIGKETWGASFIGKRLIAFTEVSNYSFVTSQAFKQLTGDDQVTIKILYRDPMTVKLECMTLITSNNAPGISNQKSDLRRLILCEMQEIGAAEATYEDRLWDEAPSILARCREVYHRLCPIDGLPIPVDNDDERLEALVSYNCSPWQAIFDDSFELCESKDPIICNRGRTTLGEFNRVMIKNKLRRSQINQFKNWLASTYGISVTKVYERETKKRIYAFVGMKPVMGQVIIGVPDSAGWSDSLD